MATIDRTTEPLIFDLVEWVGKRRPSYGELMDAWRTSCPRLTIWEDALERGYVRREFNADGAIVVITERGREFLLAKQSDCSACCQDGEANGRVGQSCVAPS